MIISRTPFRISFFGGGTDYPEYYNEFGGATLSTTIDKYCYISVHRLTPFFKHRYRASYAKTESVMNPEEFQHPLIRESLLHLTFEEGIEISHVADLPGRTGLGSSSSFTVGLLNALHHFRDEKPTAVDLAEEAVCIERQRVKDTGGRQDQYAAAFGGLQIIHYTREHITPTPVLLRSERLKELDQNLLLFYMGQEVEGESIALEQKKKIGENSGSLQTMKEMVYEGERILTSSENMEQFGNLLHEAWKCKKSLSKGITTPQIDQAYEAAREAGALGGKLLGAGGRGFLALYATPECHAGIRAALKNLLEVSFSFAPDGSRIIFCSDE